MRFKIQKESIFFKRPSASFIRPTTELESYTIYNLLGQAVASGQLSNGPLYFISAASLKTRSTYSRNTKQYQASQQEVHLEINFK